ncbi:MAG: UDP-2,4-diacetamido-2,4,6-trideoxy-beta-L-altropyranose hydrolase [Polyangiaceae bacterium]
MSDTLLLRADADARIGTGHFMRMLALAEAWREGGGDATFGGRLPEALVPRALAIGAKFVPRPEGTDDAEWTVALAGALGATRVVADGYGFPLAFQRKVRASGLRLAVVDDNAENAPYDADWIVNVNFHASQDLVSRRNADARCLLGPNFALVRGEFRRSGERRAPRDETPKVLVTMGGADPPDATGAILDAFARRPPPKFETIVLVGGANPRLGSYTGRRIPRLTLAYNVEDVADIMRNVDVALAAIGATTWELALSGVPSVVVALADNQVPLAEILHAKGAVDYVGDVRVSRSAEPWLDRVDALLADPTRREALVNASRNLVDGRGASRIVQSLKEA